MKNLAKVERAMDESPLCAQHVLDIALILHRALPASDAENSVLRFVQTLPSSDGEA